MVKRTMSEDKNNKGGSNQSTGERSPVEAPKGSEKSSRSTIAIDMREFLPSEEHGSKPELLFNSGTESTLKIKSPVSKPPTLSETAIDGHLAVQSHWEKGPHLTSKKRLSQFTRLLPLFTLISLALMGLGHAVTLMSEGAEYNLADIEELSDKVTLESGSFSFGLDDEIMSAVLAFCFQVSTNPNTECRRGAFEDRGEFPAQTRSLPAFQMDRYEVSNIRYQECENAGICPPRLSEDCELHTHRGWQMNEPIPERLFSAEFPAVCINMEDAETFCRWAGGRLPSSYEWERAARGGDDRIMPWGPVWAPDLINWAETDMGGFPVAGHLDAFDLTAPVNRFRDGSTSDDIYNMLGNASEWVRPFTATDEDSQRQGATRGRSYRHNMQDHLRLTYEATVNPVKRRSDIGFRCVYDIL
jgi:formylglycine-generating enzyme required for sulfatase activity